MRAIGDNFTTYRAGLFAGIVTSWRMRRVTGEPWATSLGPLWLRLRFIGRRVNGRNWRAVRSSLIPWRAECDTCWRHVGFGLTETAALRRHYRLHQDAPAKDDA